MESLVSDVCVTYTTAGQLTQLRCSTRRCATLCVLFLLLFEARTAFSDAVDPEGEHSVFLGSVVKSVLTSAEALDNRE